jgi:hypothetical protein
MALSDRRMRFTEQGCLHHVFHFAPWLHLWRSIPCFVRSLIVQADCSAILCWTLCWFWSSAAAEGQKARRL